MNFQTVLKSMLISTSQIEYKLQNYKQLLNEQIQFNFNDLYAQVCGHSDPSITAYHLYDFLQSFDLPVREQDSLDQIDQETSGNSYTLQELESVIKGYNCCTSMKYHLSLIEFSLIFISKQNNLLAKLTLERNSMASCQGQWALPLYLQNYARRILLLECQLHRLLLKFKMEHHDRVQLWIKRHISVNQQSNQQEFDEQEFCRECGEIGVEIDYELVLRNWRLTNKQNVRYDRMLALFTLKNVQNVHRILKNRAHQLEIGNNPFIRPEFVDCIERNINSDASIIHSSFRQFKSIEKHVQRLGSPPKVQLIQKIANFRKLLSQEIRAVFSVIIEIIELERQLEYQRIELALSADFYPVLIFDSLQRDRDDLLLPSLLKDYFEKFGVKLELSEIYLLFKRYSDRSDGKLSFDQFCTIFDLCPKNRSYVNIQRNRRVNCLNDMQLETKKQFLKLIKRAIKVEVAGERAKYRLLYRQQTAANEPHCKALNLRDVFNCVDEDEDGYISQLDLKIAYKRFLQLDLSDEDLQLFWHRMGVRENSRQATKYPTAYQTLTPQRSADTQLRYEIFVAQLMPSVQSNPQQHLKKACKNNQSTKLVGKTLSTLSQNNRKKKKKVIANFPN